MWATAARPVRRYLNANIEAPFPWKLGASTRKLQLQRLDPSIAQQRAAQLFKTVCRGGLLF